MKGWMVAAGFAAGLLAGLCGTAQGTNEQKTIEKEQRVLRVDRVEDAWVVLEVGDGQRVDIPLNVFPDGLQEGDGLVLVRVTDARLDQARRRIERLKQRGEWGQDGRQ